MSGGKADGVFLSCAEEVDVASGDFGEAFKSSCDTEEFRRCAGTDYGREVGCNERHSRLDVCEDLGANILER